MCRIDLLLDLCGRIINVPWWKISYSQGTPVMQTSTESSHWSAATGIMHRAQSPLVRSPRHTRLARAHFFAWWDGLERAPLLILLLHVHAFLGFETRSIVLLQLFEIHCWQNTGNISKINDILSTDILAHISKYPEFPKYVCNVVCWYLCSKVIKKKVFHDLFKNRDCRVS